MAVAKKTADPTADDQLLDIRDEIRVDNNRTRHQCWTPISLIKIKQTSRAANISKRVQDVSSVATTVCKRLTRASDDRRAQCDM